MSEPHMILNNMFLKVPDLKGTISELKQTSKGAEFNLHIPVCSYLDCGQRVHDTTEDLRMMVCGKHLDSAINSIENGDTVKVTPSLRLGSRYSVSNIIKVEL